MNNNGGKKDSATPRESLIDLLVQLVNNSAAVFHDEIELAIQGIREKVKAVRGGILTIATGALISFAALLSFSAAVIMGLTSYMSPVSAALVTGTALAFIGGFITFIGYRQLTK